MISNIQFSSGHDLQKTVALKVLPIMYPIDVHTYLSTRMQRCVTCVDGIAKELCGDDLRGASPRVVWNIVYASTFLRVLGVNYPVRIGVPSNTRLGSGVTQIRKELSILSFWSVLVAQVRAAQPRNSRSVFCC